MKNIVRVSLLVAAALMVAALLRAWSVTPAPAAPAAVVVETFSGTATTQLAVPGVKTSQGVRFSTQTTLDSISFDSQVRTFRNQAVDFHGREADFLASQVGGYMEYRVGATTPTAQAKIGIASGSFVASGAVIATGQASYPNAATLKGFSELRAEFANGATCALTGTTADWSSNVIPQLNGAVVTAQIDTTFTLVDAANGLLEDHFTGTLSAQEAAVDRAPGGGVDQAWLGMALSLTGCAGLGRALVRRRRAPQGG